jgi:hypothetical protein
MALQIDQEDREPVAQQQLGPRQHGRAVGADGVKKKNDRRVAALIQPPAGDGVPGPWERDNLGREAGWQRNRVVDWPHEVRTKHP